MTTQLTSQYEIIGSRIARVQSTTQDSDLQKNIGLFLEKYSTAPLFIVGLSTETMVDYRTRYGNSDEECEMHKNFHLPFPIMLLDFPSGLFPGSTVSGLNDQFLMYIETLNDNEYLIEVLRTSEATHKQLKETSQHKKDTILSVPEFKKTLEKTENGAGEAAAFIMKIDRQKGEVYHSYSKEFVYDCQILCEDDPDICMYTNYSECRPNGSICTIKTPICRMQDDSANFGIGLLLMVIDYINRPDRFIIKVTPAVSARELRLKEKGRKYSFNKKQTHIVLDHSQVREIIAASHGGSHASPLPHQRRGHWRQLKAECFKEKIRVWVRPTDINKGLKIKVKKNVYEVIS